MPKTRFVYETDGRKTRSDILDESAESRGEERTKMSTYVCGDVHGQKRLFDAVLERVGFSPDDELVVIGDAIDRGPDGIGILKFLMETPNAKCLLGNHELMMWTQYRCRGRSSYWMNPQNGGIVTRREFESLSPDEREKILDFVEDMYLQVEVELGGKKFLLSHSDFVPERGTMKWRETNSYDEAFDVVWNSPWRLWEYVPKEKYAEDGRFHVIGHVPAISLRENPNPTEAYVDEEFEIANVDMGCARMSPDFDDGNDGKSLCVMNLTKYAESGKDGAFVYAFPKRDGTVGFR